MREGCKGGKRYLMLVVAVMVVVVVVMVGGGGGRCSGGTNWIEDFFQLSASIFFGGGFTGPNTPPISNNCVNSFIIAFWFIHVFLHCYLIIAGLIFAVKSTEAAPRPHTSSPFHSSARFKGLFSFCNYMRISQFVQMYLCLYIIFLVHLFFR